MPPKFAPSILTADFTRLGEQIREAEAAGVDWIHLDIMDGNFVPNITFGPVLVQAVRQVTKLPLDVHLMIAQPERYLADFAQAGANWLTVHVETCPHLHSTVQQIKALGCQAGVTLNPATPLPTLEEILPEVDLILVMSVNPGFGGQKYIPGSTGKIARLRAMLDAIGSPAELEVDGGINAATIAEVVKAGASVLVIGSAIFNSKAPIAENVRTLRERAG
ncbi:MAG: ribulose-phosphate 3-epimerase [Chloroflexota bacterium]|nr:MAG: ribulose-phosphate 3-epimerase [Chloroflexota bacterium]